MSSKLTLLFVVALGCARNVPRPTGLPRQRAAPEEVESLVRTAIASRFRAADIPGEDLLEGTDPVLVFEEMQQAGYTLSPAALPSETGPGFHMISRGEAQELAYGTFNGLALIAVDEPEIVNDRAALKMGVGSYPDVRAGWTPIWHCWATAEFLQMPQGWTFVRWSDPGCY